MLNPGIKPHFHFIRLEFWIILVNSRKVWANSEPSGFSLGFRFASRLPEVQRITGKSTSFHSICTSIIQSEKQHKCSQHAAYVHQPFDTSSLIARSGLQKLVYTCFLATLFNSARLISILFPGCRSTHSSFCVLKASVLVRYLMSHSRCLIYPHVSLIKESLPSCSGVFRK